MSEKKPPTNEPKELTKEERDTFSDWLTDKWGQTGGKCYVCQASHWAIGPHLVTPTLYSETGFWAGGPSYPEALIICTNCGHTVHFNAIAIGLVEKAEPEDESSEEVANG